ncbi:hypothetical protein CNR22_10255 [Sphingobacteriaceae bacterium]|nr:hypothetical protein CNR22_10255 [Sphingobacteriaceae bacterium]
MRGLFNSLALLRAEQLYEKKFGIRTSKIKRSDSAEYFHYQGASYQQLNRILTEIYPFTKGFQFVDIGCGKGRAVFVAESIGFNDIAGIELDESLLHEAIENLKLYPMKRKESHIEFLQANALDYHYKNIKTVYFLFNPFNEEILNKVVEKIKAESASETWFIYMNPLYPKPFENSGIELVRKFKTRFYTEANVYRMNNKLH